MSLADAILRNCWLWEIIDHYDLQIYVEMVAQGRQLDADDLLINQYGC